MVLNLTYHPDVPTAVIEMIEHHARRLGVTLDALELIGQSLDLSESFIVASESGMGAEYATAIERGVAPPVPLAVVALRNPGKAAS